MTKQTRSPHWYHLIGIYVLCIAFIYSIQHNLPEPKLETVPGDIFSEGRAIKNLKYIAEDIGVRPLGSANQERTRHFILDHLHKLKLQTSSQITMDINVQHVSGIRGDKYMGAIFKYNNLTNIVVKLSSTKTNKASNGSVLISSHYDSAVGSPGAFDDGIPIVVMLEVISNLLSKHQEDPSLVLKHDIIFLFNDAEEVGLLGAAAFVKKHEWASDVKVFLNLEAAGVTGKPILFQSTNAWVMNEYAEAIPYPKGNAVAQDIFDLGIIPSLTDYRVYSNELRLGSASGIDTAFYMGGHHYHTHLDNMKNIYESPGAIQMMGENTLAFAKHFGYVVNELETGENFAIDTITKPVFCDLFGYKLVSASVDALLPPFMVSFFIALVIVIITLFRIQRTTTFLRTYVLVNLGKVMGAIVIILISGILAILLPYLCGMLTSMYLQNMTFYAASPYYVFVLYGPASLLGTLLPIYALSNLFRTNMKSMYCAVWIIWILALGFGSSMFIACSYLAFIAVFVLTVGSFLWNQKSLLVYIVVPLPTIFLLDTVFNVTNVFSPMTGRMNESGDTILAILVGGSVFIIISLALPFLYNNKIVVTKRILMIVFGVAIGVLGVSQLFMFPYSQEKPKRVLVQHVFIHTEIEFTLNRTILPNKYVDSYLGLSSDDSVPSSFIQKHSTLPYKFKYSPPSVLFTLASQTLPDEPQGYYITNTRKEYTNDTVIHPPSVTVKCETGVCNRVVIKIADRNDKFKAFSHELTILSRFPLLDSSMGEVLKSEERAQNMTYTEGPGSVKLYKSRVLLFSGAHSGNSTHEIWTSYKTKTRNAKQSLIQVAVSSIFLDQEAYSKEMNKTLDALPTWVAPLPCVATYRVLHFLLDA